MCLDGIRHFYGPKSQHTLRVRTLLSVLLLDLLVWSKRTKKENKQAPLECESQLRLSDKCILLGGSERLPELRLAAT